MRKRERYKPAVSKNVLLLVAGVVWLMVGLMLVLIAFSWLRAAVSISIYHFVIAGVVLGLLVHHFGFLRIVNKNVRRILPMDEKRCLFSFIPWMSYVIIAVMISGGAILRHSAIPKHYLAIVYIGIGLALALSSVRYFRVFIREIARKKLP
jgi:hypothetical protein